MKKSKNNLKNKRKNTPYEWLLNADMLYLGCRALFKYNDIYLWFPAAHLLVQSLEQYLKAFLKYKKVGFPTGFKGHNLSLIYKKCCINGMKEDPEIKKSINTLNKLYALRYMDNKFQGSGLGIEELDELDFIVAFIRPQIISLSKYDNFSKLPKYSTHYKILIWKNKMKGYFNLIK